jgi:hypothetical protein
MKAISVIYQVQFCSDFLSENIVMSAHHTVMMI